MAAAKLDSMLLSTHDPVRLRDWYAAAFSPDVSQEGDYQVLGLGGFYVLIDTRDDIAETNPEPGRVIFNLDVEDARAIAERLDSLGARWLSPLEDREGSLFGTVIDPDGNYVQIIQLSEDHRAAMEEAAASRV